MTSLSFTNTVSTSTKFTTHQPRVRNRNIPTDYSLLWFWGIWLWSGPPWPTLTTQTPWSTGARPFCQRERKGCGETKWQVAITRTTAVELDDGSLGGKPKACGTRQGQMLRGFHRLWLKRAALPRVPPYFITNGLPGEARPRQRVTGQGHLLLPIKHTLVDTQLKRCSWVQPPEKMRKR